MQPLPTHVFNQEPVQEKQSWVFFMFYQHYQLKSLHFFKVGSMETSLFSATQDPIAASFEQKKRLVIFEMKWHVLAISLYFLSEMILRII